MAAYSGDRATDGGGSDSFARDTSRDTTEAHAVPDLRDDALNERIYSGPADHAQAIFGSNALARTIYAGGGDEVELDPLIGEGLVLPTSVFRSVDVTIRNQDGDPFEHTVIQVMPRHIFPIASGVDGQGNATLRLLRGYTYEYFQIVTELPGTDALGVFYETDGNPDIGIQASGPVELRFNEAETPRTVVDVTQEQPEKSPLEVT